MRDLRKNQQSADALNGNGKKSGNCENLLGSCTKSRNSKGSKTETLLKEERENNKSTVFPKPTEGAKEAVLNYEIIKVLDNFQLLEVDLETGRHHQIRAQLSKIGASIKGDLKYGAARSNADGGIHLHARKLTFKHPVSLEEISVIAPVPKGDAIWEACEIK